MAISALYWYELNCNCKDKAIHESTSIVATVYLSLLVVNCFLLCGWDSHVLMLSVYHRPVVFSNGSEGGWVSVSLQLLYCWDQRDRKVYGFI